MEEVAIAWRNDNLQNLMSKLYLVVVVYAIWKGRNRRCFSSGAFSKELIMSSIIRTYSYKGVNFENIIDQRKMKKLLRNRGYQDVYSRRL